jgi:hypothetical protein
MTNGDDFGRNTFLQFLKKADGHRTGRSVGVGSNPEV